MKHSDFKIGMKFRCGNWAPDSRQWYVTDVGTRTVVAIRVVKDWMAGPPYAQEEHVFDENDFPVCEPVA